MEIASSCIVFNSRMDFCYHYSPKNQSMASFRYSRAFIAISRIYTRFGRFGSFPLPFVVLALCFTNNSSTTIAITSFPPSLIFYLVAESSKKGRVQAKHPSGLFSAPALPAGAHRPSAVDTVGHSDRISREHCCPEFRKDDPYPLVAVHCW